MTWNYQKIIKKYDVLKISKIKSSEEYDTVAEYFRVKRETTRVRIFKNCTVAVRSPDHKISRYFTSLETNESMNWTQLDDYRKK